MRNTDQTGFTLIEFAIFLFIAGTVLGVAAAAWSVLVQGRQIQATRNILDEANNCLMDYLVLSKRIPSTLYFTNSCSKGDPWGNSLRFVTGAAGQGVNCTAQTPGSLTVRLSATDLRNNIAWILISAGPNRAFDYIQSGSSLDLSTGDDVYVFISDMEIHQQTCR